MPTKPKGVRVRGTCKAGHTTEATSAPGRVTWQGPCATDGCDLTVTARRIAGNAGKPPPTARQADAAAAAKAEGKTGNDPHQVKEIAGYGSKKRGGRSADGGDGRGPDVPPAGSPQHRPGGDDAGSGGPGAGPDDDKPAERHTAPVVRTVDSQRRDPANGRFSGGRARLRAARERGRVRAEQRRAIEREQGILPHILPR